MQYVGVGLRAVATIVDTILLLVVGYVMAMAIGGTSAEGFHLEGGPFFLWTLIAFGYYIVMEAKFGATIGKRMVGLKVVKLEGAASLDWQAAIVRNILRLVDGFLFYLIGAIVVWTSDKKQRLGYKVAHTVVIKSGGSHENVPDK
jgi:uncharacterized RDD family membrane protein YckC